ncbi:hypothetical protein DPMN_167300 [Dreissena polymorpha]|uniref:Uncharacterized protein n=1 Tax=Dreissena polymorpha TaxID=45954 RepID=A0A9D4EYJ3_DREPO|nr:hypothetical protein DPMN_167300 [Dreissena polymorpha]
MEFYNAESNAILSPPTYPTVPNDYSESVPKHRSQQSLLSSVYKEHGFQHMSTASYVAYPVAQDNQTGGQQLGLNILSAAMNTLQ